MSKFNHYAKKVDEIARAAFKEYREAEKNYKAAEKVRSLYPKPTGMASADYMAKSARAEADCIEAKENFKKARAALEGHTSEIAALREELAAELADHYSADPAAIDHSTLDLIKSGILSSSEYAKLMKAAKGNNNFTMARLIAKAAKEAAAAEEKRNGNSPAAAELRQVSKMANDINGNAKLADFDHLANVYSRATHNSGMIDYWDSLCNETIENF